MTHNLCEVSNNSNYRSSVLAIIMVEFVISLSVANLIPESQAFASGIRTSTNEKWAGPGYGLLLTAKIQERLIRENFNPGKCPAIYAVRSTAIYAGIFRG